MTPDKLDAVSDFLMDSEDVKQAFPDSSSKDLRVEIVSTTKDALLVVQDPKNPSINPPSIRASELGNRYREQLAEKQTIELMDAEKEMDNKRRYANLRKYRTVGEFSASLGPLGSRNEWLSDEFKDLFFSSDRDTKYKLAAAVMNAERTPKDSRQRADLTRIADEARNTRLVAFIKEQASKVVLAETPAEQLMTTADLFTYMGQDIAQMPELGALDIAEAKEFANFVQKMPEGEVLIPEFIRAQVTEMHASAYAERYLAANPGNFEVPEAISSRISQNDYLLQDDMKGFFGGDTYKTALAFTLAEEAGYHPSDVGSQTFMGIRRANNPTWDVWSLIDTITGDSVTYPTSNNKIDAINELRKDPTVRVSAAKKYKEDYYDWLNLDKATDQSLTYVMFDHAVNAGQPRAAIDARNSLKDIGIKDIKVSSKPLTDGEVLLINRYVPEFKKAFTKRMMDHYNQQKAWAPNAARKIRLMGSQSIGEPLKEYMMQLEAERAIRTDQPTTE